MRRLRILYLGRLPPHEGGTATLGAYLVRGLGDRGHALHALAPLLAERLAEPDAFALRHPHVTVTRFPVPHAVNHRVGGPLDGEYREAEGGQIQERLPRLLGDLQPDVLVIGQESMARHAPEIAQARGVPSVLLVQGGSTLRLLQERRPGPGARGLIGQFRRTDLVVAVARHLSADLRTLGVRRMTVIPTPVDLERFVAGPKDPGLLRALALPEDATIVLYVSNMLPLKRPLDVVASAARALARRPDLAYLIVGDGAHRVDMEAACRREGVLDRFRFTGWLDHARIPEHLRLAALVVVPSESEGLAHVYLEAQACARLVVASDIPGAREVIVDGETGLLFPRRDVAELAAKTVLAAEDPALRAEVGGRAARRVRTHALSEALVAYERVLETVVAGRGSRSA